MAESEEQAKSLLMKVKEESEKAGLKFNNQKTKIIISGPIISWHIDVEKSGSSDKLYFLGLQNHLDSDCSQEIKTHLLLGRKTMINLDSILKIRDITLLTKIHIICQRSGFSISHIQI